MPGTTTTTTTTINGPHLHVQRAAARIRPSTVDRERRTFDVVFSTGEIVSSWFGRLAPEVTDRAARLDWLNAGTAPFLQMHGRDSLEDVIGVVVANSARIVDGRGLATVRLSQRPAVDWILADIADGVITNVSMGWVGHEWDTRKDEDGEKYELAVDWEPLEISLVDIPADPGSRVQRRDQGCATSEPALDCARPRAVSDESGDQQVLDQLHTQAASDEELDLEADAAQDAAPDADPDDDDIDDSVDVDQDDDEDIDEDEDDDDLDAADVELAASDRQRIVSAERTRVRQITRLCQQHGMPGRLRNQMIDRGTSVNDARSRILRRLRQRSDGVGGNSRRVSIPASPANRDRIQQFGTAVRGALLHRMDSSHTDNQLDGQSRDFAGMSMADMARQCLEFSGVSTRRMSSVRIVDEMFSQTARHGLIRQAGEAAHSTSDFSNILIDAMHVRLRQTYMGTPRTFPMWCRSSTVTDFRDQHRVQIGGAPDLERVNEGGEFTHGTMDDQAAKYRIYTDGRIISLTRQAIINDSLSAFNGISAAFGRSAADKESDTVYGLLTNSATTAPDGTALFHADHANLGTGSKITEAALTAMEQSMSEQEGLEGRPISIRPTYLLVPFGNRSVEARKLLTAVMPEQTANVNVYAGRYTLIEEVRLKPDSGNRSWYAAASPMTVDTIEYAHLAGNEMPFTESRMGFDVDGIQIKCRHDFGAGVIDYRGLYKNPGA